jgi:hypothetical protein
MRKTYGIALGILVAVVAFLGIAWSNHSTNATIAAVSANPITTVNNFQASLPAQADVSGSAIAQNTQASSGKIVSLPAASFKQAAANANVGSPVAASAAVTTIKTDAYGQIAIGFAQLMNNVWGAPLPEVFTSGIFQNPDGSFGWYWARQDPMIKAGQTHVTPIYPSIRIGGTCLNRSGSPYFPIKVGDAKTLVFNVAYDYPQTPSGSYDLAYDLFFSDPSQPNSNPKIAAEVMIWLDTNIKPPLKNFKGNFTDGTNTFALYSWTMADGRTYYSFVLESSPGSGGQYQIDAKKLLDQINLNSNWLIHGVEFGTEIYNGEGQIHISQFGVTMNGNQIMP